jgi:hypothetical protein
MLLQRGKKLAMAEEKTKTPVSANGQEAGLCEIFHKPTSKIFSLRKFDDGSVWISWPVSKQLSMQPGSLPSWGGPSQNTLTRARKKTS